MRAKDINTKRGHGRGKTQRWNFVVAPEMPANEKRRSANEKQNRKFKERKISGREHNNSSLRGAASLRSTASSSAIFTVYRMREISRRCFV